MASLARFLVYKHNPFQRFAVAFPSTSNASYGSYTASPPALDNEKNTSYREVSSDHWKFVERLKPESLVPSYPKLDKYPSGWTPPSDVVPELPYFVPRNRNHMVPVYLRLEAMRGQRKITIIRSIQGDIWALEKALKSHLEKLRGQTIVTQVHEVAMYIKVRGDHVLAVKEWLINAGF